MSRYERDRGRRFEQEVAAQLRDALPGATVVRGQQGRGGADAPDVAVDGGGSRWLGIECKRGNPPPLLPALRQAVRDCEGTGRVPMAVVRADREEALALMRADDLDDLCDALAVETGARPTTETHAGKRLRDALAAAELACEGRMPVGLLRERDGWTVALSWSDLLHRILAPLWAARVRHPVGLALDSDTYTAAR